MVKDRNKYFSLQEAAKHCIYSQEYLSLRARQGKLKAVKFGRKWVTKAEWLEDYLRTAEDYKINLNGERVNYFQQHAASPSSIFPTEILIQDEPSRGKNLVFALAMSIVLITTSLSMGKQSISFVYQETAGYRQSIEKIIINPASEKLAAISETGIAKSVAEDLSGYGKWISGFFDNIVNGYVALCDSLGKKFSKEEITYNEPEELATVEGTNQEGIIVVPVDDGEEEARRRLEDLKASFSDEVQIEKDDEAGLSGVIVPVFKEPTDQKYFYMMVPIKNN